MGQYPNLSQITDQALAQALRVFCDRLNKVELAAQTTPVLPTPTTSAAFGNQRVTNLANAVNEQDGVSLKYLVASVQATLTTAIQQAPGSANVTPATPPVGGVVIPPPLVPPPGGPGPDPGVPEPVPPTPPPSGPTGVDQINFSTVIIEASPAVIRTWPIATAITQIDVLPSGVSVTFSKRDGPGRWPDVTPPGWSGPLQYTLWLFLFIGGQWYGSGIIQFWYGLAASGGNITVGNQIANNWVYAARWGPMFGHQPAPGELIGMMVSAGNQRSENDYLVAQRSNIVTFNFPAAAPATFHF